MNIEKIMCDRLGYKYKDLFGHLEFILNKMNMLLNNYGNGLSDEELKMLNELFLKLETGQIEIIEFKNQICQFDVDKKVKEEKEKIELEKDKEIERLDNIIDDLKQKNNLAENILYDYLYNDGKITKEKYEQFKGLKEGTNER